MSDNRPIGAFDSGVGGLSVLRHLCAQLPHERFLYIADQAHVPYGSKSAATIRFLSEQIAQFLFTHNVKLIVIPCNTASAAALTYLRQKYAPFPFVGVEPAVKAGAEQTRNGKVGVLATAGTFESQRYAELMARYAHNVRLWQNPCLGLVEQIEAGAVQSAETEHLLHSILHPMLNEGVDTLVLGCTHYPFVQPLIRTIVGGNVTIIDPAPAVARQTERVLARLGLLADQSQEGAVEFYTSGETDRFAQQLDTLWPHPHPPVSPISFSLAE